MSREGAVRAAVELFNMPAQLRAVRAQPLPDGTQILLEIAAGETDAVEEAARYCGRPRDHLVSAAVFYIEQILLAPTSGSYRILASEPETPAADIRVRMALLMRWLHPDKSGDAGRAAQAARVAQAWENLKTADRRRSYDRFQELAPPSPAPIKGKSRAARKTKVWRSIKPVSASQKRKMLIQRFFSYFDKQ